MVETAGFLEPGRCGFKAHLSPSPASPDRAVCCLKKKKKSVVDGSRKRGLKRSLTCTQFWRAMLRAWGGQWAGKMNYSAGPQPWSGRGLLLENVSLIPAEWGYNSAALHTGHLATAAAQLSLA